MLPRIINMMFFYSSLFVITFITNLAHCKHMHMHMLTKLQDLTWPFDNKTIFWPGSQQFEFTKKIINKDEEKGHWYTTNDFCSGEHGGTHLDAPYHFNEHGYQVGMIPTDRFVIPGFLVDIHEEVEKKGALRNLEVSDLTKWEEEHGLMPNNSVMLVRFGYSKYWNDKKRYLGMSENDMKLSFPGITEEAAKWIVNNKEIYGVGLDVASVDPGNSETSTMHAHRIFAKNNIYNLENVCLVHEIPVRNFTLIVAPMKIGEGSGAPVRIFAVWDEETTS